MNSFLIFKALHIISFISWMAGMLYLPRIFVYHSKAKAGSSESETFKIMEKRLLRFIMTPAMILTFIFGILLISTSPSYYMSAPWFHSKLLLVILMSAMHGYFAFTVKKFSLDQSRKQARFFKIINEVPTILMILIVFLVVLK